MSTKSKSKSNLKSVTKSKSEKKSTKRVLYPNTLKSKDANDNEGGTGSTYQRKKSKLHIRKSAKSDSDTLCGGSHSAIWKHTLKTVNPQQAKKVADAPNGCGRCLRVARSKGMI